MIQCETGLLSVTGTPETPAKVGISIADISAGMYAYSGILLSLYQREQTGAGIHFEVSLFEALGEWMAQPAYFTAYGGNPPPRSGASHASIAPYGPFLAQDGKTVFLGVQNEREWRTFCERVLEYPELATDERFRTNPRRVANSEALNATIQEVFSHLTAEQITARLEDALIASSRLNSLQEFWEHPQLQARQRWRDVDSPVGQVWALLPPITMQDFEPRMDPIPAVGEHTVAILRATLLLARKDRATARRERHLKREVRTNERAEKGWSGRFYEDLEVGDIYQHPLGRTVTTTDNLWFTLLTQNTAPVHVDHEYASQTEFGKPLVNSTFTFALVTGRSVSDISQNVLANLSWDEVRLPSPVFEGDTIYSQSEFLSKR